MYLLGLTKIFTPGIKQITLEYVLTALLNCLLVPHLIFIARERKDLESTMLLEMNAYIVSAPLGLADAR